MSPRRITSQIVSLAFLLTQLTGAPEVWARQAPNPCPDAKTVSVNATVEPDAHRGPFVARLIADDRGFLAIDVTAPLDVALAYASQPRLTLLDTGCGDAAGGVQRIHETPNGLIVRVREPGAVYVAVSAVDPSTRPGRFTLHSAFGAEPLVPDTIVTLDADPPAHCAAAVPPFGPDVFDTGAFALTDRPGGWTRDVEPDECDVLEGAFDGSGVAIVAAQGVPLVARLFAGHSCAADGWLAEASLANGGDLVVPVHPGWHRLVLDPLASGPMAYTLGVKFVGLCGPVRDDHADVIRCGTALDAGTPAEGLLGDGNDRRDDDAFTFSIAEQATVTLRVDTEIPISGALFDHAGVRLAPRLACDGTACALTVTLPAGRYGLRLSATDDAVPVVYTVGYSVTQ